MERLGSILKYPPKQVYINCCLTGETKGPHLHKIRSGAFVTITGKLLFVARHEDKYYEFSVEPQNGKGMKLIEIPPGVPCCIYNIGTTDAIFLNMPSPAWSSDLPDDWPVENWKYKLSIIAPADKPS